MRAHAVIQIETGFFVPQQSIYALLPRACALAPDAFVGIVPEDLRDRRRVRFHLIEEGVQTDRGVVDDVDAEWSEAVGGIEARFSHRPVTLVEQICELILGAVV